MCPNIFAGADNYSDEEHSDDESNASTFSSPASSVVSLPESNTSGALSTPGLSLLENASSRAVEFESEAQLSLERAFNEGHRIEDAVIELKTLRMSSNVPQRQVLNAVVRFLVEKIQLVEGNVQQQKAAIAKVVQRWGPLLNSLGAADGEETIELLQVRRAGVGLRRGCCSPIACTAETLFARKVPAAVRTHPQRVLHGRHHQRGRHYGVVQGSKIANRRRRK